MNNVMYVVNDMVFENQAGKYNARARAKAYCDKNDIDYRNMLQANNEAEVYYIQKLLQRDVCFISTHEKIAVTDGFYNAVGQSIPAIVIDVPFHYADEDGNHYEWLVADVYDLTIKLTDAKILFDKSHKNEGCYLKLLCLGDNNEIKEFTLEDLESVRYNFMQEEHKKTLKHLHKLRERQTYDRLRKLREEGRITESQTKALYKLEERYGK